MEPSQQCVNAKKLNKDIVYHEYVVNQKSDYEIAEMYGVHRSSVTHIRKYHGIETKTLTWEAGHYQVKSKLILEGFTVRDLREKSKSSLFNFLVNRVVRIQVLSSKASKGKFAFSLPPRDEGDISEDNKFFTKGKDGKWRKDFSKTCDIVILCGFIDKDVLYYLIPSSAMKVDKSVISFSFDNDRWNKFKDRWDLVHKLYVRKTS